MAFDALWSVMLVPFDVCFVYVARALPAQMPCAVSDNVRKKSCENALPILVVDN